jgi:hypothetical protein
MKKTLKMILPALSLTLISAVAGFAADALPRDIPLQNPGFESGLNNWSSGNFTDQVSVVDTPVHSGSKAVKIGATAKSNSPFIGNVAKDLTGSATYQFSVWARVAPGTPAVAAAVKMENYNDAGKNTSGFYGRVTLPADGAWKQISVTEQVDADTTRSNLLLRVFGKGAVIFDDATFALVKDPPEVMVSNPLQMAIAPNRAMRVTYSLAFRQPWTEKNPPEITANVRPLDAAVDSSETNLIRAYPNRTDSRHFNATFALPKLAPGDYAVDFGYRRDGKFLQTAAPAYIFTTVPDRQPKYLTDNGAILWHGKPFFPIGMYHPGDYYKLLAENGFNVVQGNSTLNMDDFKKSLDDAEKYGLAVDVPFYGGGQVKKNLANSLEKIQKFADHPAVLCWKIKDEPDITSNTGIAAEVPGAYRAFKEADPNHPIELTLAHDATLGFWSNFCDIVQIDRYPVHSATEPSDLTPVSSFSRNAKSVMQPWQNLTFDVQCGWTLDLGTQPTVPQARSMVYLALTSGAKGIFWYSMTESSGWDLTKTPFWPHMKDINAEIKTISEPILVGDNVPVQTSNLFVHVIGKKYQNKVYVYFTNPTTQDVNVTFRLSGLPSIADGKFINTAFTNGNEKIKVDHSTGAPNSISMKLSGLQSGTMVFDGART